MRRAAWAGGSEAAERAEAGAARLKDPEAKAVGVPGARVAEGLAV